MKEIFATILDYVVLILLILLFFWVASCTSEDQIVFCAKNEPINGVACVEIFQPVIAPDGTEYPNSCYAERDGWDNSCLKFKSVYYD